MSAADPQTWMLIFCFSAMFLAFAWVLIEITRSDE